MYGLEIESMKRVYLCTLVELPTHLECMKTLDKNYFKSCDCTQMLIVHSKFLDMNEDKKKLKSPKLIEFNPLSEEGFLPNLYDRKSYTQHNNTTYELRHGLTPGTRNIRNFRWKKKLNEKEYP